MRAHRTLIVSLILTLALAIPAVASGKRLIMAGSTAMLPMVQKLAAAYHQQNPKIPAPKVGGCQSGCGITEVAAGRIDIADVSRDPLESDPHHLVFTKVARDGVCMMTNSANPVGNISQETVQEIYDGSIRDWSNVPGSTMTGPIDLFDHDQAAGTQDAFQNIFMGEGLKISPSATQESSEGLEVNAVHADSKAIGFTSFAATINGGVHDIPYQGIPCTLQNAKSGQYGGVRNFWMVTKGRPTGEAAKFISWVVKPGNKVVRSIIASEWIAIH